MVWVYWFNLDIDLRLMGIEWFYVFVGLMDCGNEFIWIIFSDGEVEFILEFDFEFDMGFFEGDLGVIVGGFGD